MFCGCSRRAVDDVAQPTQVTLEQRPAPQAQRQFTAELGEAVNDAQKIVALEQDLSRVKEELAEARRSAEATQPDTDAAPAAAEQAEDGTRRRRATTTMLSRTVADLAKTHMAENSEQLEEKLAGLFAAADADGNGVLSPAELKALLLKAGWGFTDEDVTFLIAQADANQDGVIDYEEFVHIGVDIITAMRARHKLGRREQLTQGAQSMLGVTRKLHGLTKAELEGAVASSFARFDANSDGRLSLAEFSEALSALRLSEDTLTRHEARAMMAAADTDGSGAIEIDEFSKAVWDYLQQAVELGFRAHETDDLASYLSEKLRCADLEHNTEITGRLSRAQMQQALQACDLLPTITKVGKHLALYEAMLATGDVLPPVRLVDTRPSVAARRTSEPQQRGSNARTRARSGSTSSSSAAKYNERDREVDYGPLVPHLSKSLVRASDPREALKRSELAIRAGIPPLHVMQNAEMQRIQSHLDQLFSKAADPATNKIAVDRFRKLMYSKECGMYLLEIGLARPDLSFPIETADLDGDGYIDKKEFYQVFMGKLLPLSREKAIASLVALQGSEQPSPTAALTAGSLLSGSALNLLAKELGGMHALLDGSLIEPEELRLALYATAPRIEFGVELEAIDECLKCLPEAPGDWGALIGRLRAIRARVAL